MLTTNYLSIAIYWFNCKPQVGRLLFPNTSSGSGFSLVITCFAQCNISSFADKKNSFFKPYLLRSVSQNSKKLLSSFFIPMDATDCQCYPYLSQADLLFFLDYTGSLGSTHPQTTMSGVMQRVLIFFNHTLELERLYISLLACDIKMKFCINPLFRMYNKTEWYLGRRVPLKITAIMFSWKYFLFCDWCNPILDSGNSYFIMQVWEGMLLFTVLTAPLRHKTPLSLLGTSQLLTKSSNMLLPSLTHVVCHMS